MTWFRCGGSGIPTALKNRMNAVFNKKFGTAVDYPAEGWPDDVNLMGPLPEKTIVSSPIADFSDGADDVPTKSLKVTIPPTLSGVSAVTETQTGKNLIDIDNFVQRSGYNNLSVSVSNNVLTLSGYDAGGRFGCFNIPTKIGVSYTVKYTARTNVQNVRVVESETEPTNWINGGSAVGVNSAYTYIATKPWVQVWIEMTADNTTVTDLQLEVGSSASTFETYQTPTQYTASLGRTIYGGQVDIVNGEGKDGYIKRKFTSTSGFSILNANDYTQFYITVSDMKNSTDAICSVLPSITLAERSTKSGLVQYASDNALRFSFLKTTGILTMEDFANYLSNNDVQVVFELLSPTDFTFDGQEIPTRLGYNAFWSDEGDTEVTYRADISLALQAVSGSRGLMMASRPAIEPSNGDQGSEESTENNIETEGEEDAR